jgi:hypothetical protein
MIFFKKKETIIETGQNGMMLMNFLWSKVTDLCQHNARILTSQKAIWAPLQMAPISTSWGDSFLEWVSYK